MSGAHTTAIARRRQDGSALLVVLGSFTLLALLAVGLLHSTQLELRLGANQRDAVHARYLALAGIAQATALLHHDEQERQRTGGAFQGRLLDDPLSFAETPLGRGSFRIERRPRRGEGGRPVAGVLDEERGLDVNHASAEELSRLPGMTPELAAAIVDWRDEDSQPLPGGAEAGVYLARTPPLRIANGRFRSLGELLMVEGMTPELLFGEDANGNDWLDPDEDDGPLRAPADDADGRLAAGLAEFLALDSAVPDTDAHGRPRIDITAASESELQAVPGIGPELARGIVAYRDRAELRSLIDLLEVTRVEEAPPGNGQPTPQPGGEAGSPGSGPGDRPGSGAGNGAGDGSRAAGPAPVPGGASPGAPPVTPGGGGGDGGASGWRDTGERIFSAELLKQVADRLTLSDATVRPGVVNASTAPVEVLEALGLSPEQAAAVVRHRASTPLRSVADLLDVPGLDAGALKPLAARLCVRSATWRIACEGTIPGSGARCRIEVRVREGELGPVIISYREDG